MTDQLSLLPDLDRASDSRKQNLCATWKNARWFVPLCENCANGFKDKITESK